MEFVALDFLPHLRLAARIDRSSAQGESCYRPRTPSRLLAAPIDRRSPQARRSYQLRVEKSLFIAERLRSPPVNPRSAFGHWYHIGHLA